MCVLFYFRYLGLGICGVGVFAYFGCWAFCDLGMGIWGVGVFDYVWYRTASVSLSYLGVGAWRIGVFGYCFFSSIRALAFVVLWCLRIWVLRIWVFALLGYGWGMVGVRLG